MPLTIALTRKRAVFLGLRPVAGILLGDHVGDGDPAARRRTRCP